MRKLKFVFITIFIMANLYGVLSGALYFFQENLIFHPSQLPQEYEFNFDSAFTEVRHTTTDGAQLHGLHFTVDQPKGTLLYYHGNAGDLSRWGEIVQYFVQKDLNVIVMDYRNFGKSTGQMSEKVLYEDAAYWFAYAKKSATETQTPLHVYGRSLGTSFATFVASRNEVHQLILETPFYSIEDEAKTRFPILPIRRLLQYKLASYSFINKVKAPITILHGTADGVVVYEHGKKLYAAIQGDNKTFVTIPDGGHNDLINFEEYREAIDGLLP